MMHKAWCNVEEVAYNFSTSSIKFQGHTGWKSTIWIQFEYDYKAGLSYQIPQICLVFFIAEYQCWKTKNMVVTSFHSAAKYEAVWD